ncbi:hypothetical protein RHMOL_Rhmol04G0079700 [Rhododendron molle]|uniref:Uncharacterized protein n=1 Tax=Rhododendron molle TaxID=49168 RepID=A0ACC0NY39_RHOML|nr:hypothetical protein RHMOL_Rhmol04G0079700 [Rhododendron molle]
MIEEVVFATDEGHKEVIDDEEIVFPKLEWLILKDLSNLKSFCSANYNFNLPSLKRVVVKRCPNLQTFTSGLVRMPPTNFITRRDDGPVIEDLNKHLQQRRLNGDQGTTEENEMYGEEDQFYYLYSPSLLLLVSLLFSSLFQEADSLLVGLVRFFILLTSRQGMNAPKNAYFTNLLQDGVILEDELSMEPQDEVGFTYANQNAEEFTQASQTSAQMGSTSKKPQRGGNFTDEEDKLLVSAYLNISLDAVQGNDQKRKTYWRRVWDYFHEHKSFVSERNENSLMNRWSAIQLSVNKFCGCYAQIELRHQSGMTEEDKVSEAKTYYKSLETSKNSSKNSSFQFEHCWKQLRYQPKWLEDFKRRKPKKNNTWTVPSPSTPELVDLQEGDATFVDLERPPGIKGEKERLKKRKKAEISTSPLVGILTDIKEEQKKASDKKMDIIQRLNVQEQERLQLDKEKLRQGEEKNLH